MEPQTSQAGASDWKCENWPLKDRINFDRSGDSVVCELGLFTWSMICSSRFVMLESFSFCTVVFSDCLEEVSLPGQMASAESVDLSRFGAFISRYPGRKVIPSQRAI